jgi:acid phosphatase family membrane protein YuiD
VYANRARLTADELMLRFSELEALSRGPMVDGHLGMAEGLAMYIARSAPNGQVANLAMQVMSDLIQIRNKSGVDASLQNTLSQLRTALTEAPS